MLEDVPYERIMNKSPRMNIWLQQMFFQISSIQQRLSTEIFKTQQKKTAWKCNGQQSDIMTLLWTIN